MSGHDYFFEGTHLYKGKYPRKDEELDALAEVGENVGKGGDGRRSDEVKLVQREQNLRCLSFLEIFIPGSTVILSALTKSKEDCALSRKR